MGMILPTRPKRIRNKLRDGEEKIKTFRKERSSDNLNDAQVDEQGETADSCSPPARKKPKIMTPLVNAGAMDEVDINKDGRGKC